MKRILILEPYYGGSHRFFLEGLQAHVIAEYTLLTLPARKWKMRMQLSALWCVEKIKEFPIVERQFDVILCSSFIDVAVLRALLAKCQGWDHGARIYTYFHENQLHYPERQAEAKSFHFAAINFHTALASDKIAFNSAYNAESFFSGCGKYLQTASEMGLAGAVAEMRAKSCILWPGIDFNPIDQHSKILDPGPPVILWNHRWEHDKNPERFFLALQELSSAGIDFRLILLGKTFPNSPRCFSEAQKVFGHRILHYGYAPSYNDYLALLCRGDVVVSTALHEFFGIAVIEAVRAGCYPLLPERLVYPELFAAKYLYREDDLPEKLAQAVLQRFHLSREEAHAITQRFSWENLAPSYSQWLFQEEASLKSVLS